MLKKLFEYSFVGQYDGKNKRVFGRFRKNNKFPRARLVMMNFLHTNNLPNKFHVHHINGDTMDDRIENLQLVSNSQHQYIHHLRDRKFGVSYSENKTEYERGRRKQPEIKRAVADTSLRWYHRNKDKINADPLKKEYKRMWYLRNRERILENRRTKYERSKT